MSDTLKRSITATLDDIAVTQRRLGIASEPDELAEAWFIIERMERQFQANRVAQQPARNEAAE